MEVGIRVQISDEGSGVNAGADLRLPSQLDLLGTARARESLLIPERANQQRRIKEIEQATRI